MKSINIKRAVLAAALFAGVGMAYGNEASLHVVFCKATVVSTNSHDNTISVTLPPTEGYYDENGDPLTYWNIGNVCPGGVADSWHGEGGPGRFTAKNDGTSGAYFYVMTGGDYNSNVELDERSQWMSSGDYIWDVIESGVFGNVDMLGFPMLSPNALRRYNDSTSYHLAFTTDVTAKVPTWHSLDHGYYSLYNHNTGRNEFVWSTDEYNQYDLTAGYMGYVDPGDYLSFDLKFWLSQRYGDRRGDNPPPAMFTFCVTASSFPLWEHNLAVE